MVTGRYTGFAGTAAAVKLVVMAIKDNAVLAKEFIICE
jgi:hypothetical protein